MLEGIVPSDYTNIQNIVLEADYLPETGITIRDVEDRLSSYGYDTECPDRLESNNVMLYARRA